MLAQASLGLLLLERQEQERRAAFSNGENIHNLQLHEGAITVIFLDFDIKSGIAQRVDNDIQLIIRFPSVHVIIYLGLVVFLIIALVVMIRSPLYIAP